MMTKASKLSRPGKVKQKEFKPKNNLPRLENYSVDPPQSYWDKWNKLTFSEANYSSWLDPKEFVKVAEETGYNNMKHVEFVSNYLTEGAKIGCEGEGRWPTSGRNDPSVSSHGWEIADEIQTWINMGICVGPLTREELPFDDFSVSPLTTRMKPNGRVRLILDLSFPHTKGVKLGMGIPLSVNSGIDTDLYKTEMSSTTLWLNSMRCGGVGALLSKMDWESAYKHVHVHSSDLKLQVFKFCNR